MSMVKVSKISDELFQINDQDIPIDKTSLYEMLQRLGGMDGIQSHYFLDKLNETEVSEFQEKIANVGVVVDIYEVEYPTPADPMKETQELAKNLDEYDDFITQHLFPGSTVDEISVDLIQNLQRNKQLRNKEAASITEESDSSSRERDQKLTSSEVFIVPLKNTDITEVEDIEKERGHDPEVVQYIFNTADWSKSVKAVDSITGDMLGYYLIAETDVSDTTNYPEFKSVEDLAQYKNKSGIEGVSLVVKPEYRGMGIGSLLKDYLEGLPYDYVWGYHSYVLDNLDHWLKRRRLVGQDDSAYVTLRDNPNKIQSSINWRSILCH